MKPLVKTSLCLGCGTCCNVCHAEPPVLEIREDKCVVVHEKSCTACGLCEQNCPMRAIKLYP